MGELYTPLMAKRFNVSIPDALAERLEPYKDKISLSAVMQAALERELAQLSLSDQEKEQRANLRAVAASAWMKRNSFIAKALGAFIQELIQKAMEDEIPDVFQYYRDLHICCRRDQLVKKIASDGRYSPWLAFKPDQETREKWVMETLKFIADEDGMIWEFDEKFENFVVAWSRREGERMPSNMFRDISEEKRVITEEGSLALQSRSTHELALQIMEQQLKSYLTENDIDDFVLDFETAFAEIEEV